MEKQTIILEKSKRIKMFTNDTYIGSISNLFEPATINIEYHERTKEYCIDYYFNGASIHFWCDRYEVETDEPKNN